jgi:hypothetical protein
LLLHPRLKGGSNERDLQLAPPTRRKERARIPENKLEAVDLLMGSEELGVAWVSRQTNFFCSHQFSRTSVKTTKLWFSICRNPCRKRIKRTESSVKGRGTTSRSKARSTNS